MTDTVPFNLASSGVFEDWPVTWYPELVWWPWHPQSVKLNWPNLFKYHEGDLTCGSTIETILHHVGCIEPCKTDRQTNQQPPIWFAQNWTAVRNNPSEWTVCEVASEGGKFLLCWERGMAQCGCDSRGYWSLRSSNVKYVEFCIPCHWHYRISDNTHGSG